MTGKTHPLLALILVAYTVGSLPAEAAPGDFVMVAETTSNTVAKVDCTLDQVAGRADVGGTPVGLAGNPWKRWVYVAVGEPSNRVVAVKADTLDVAEVSGTVGYSYAGGISLSMDGSKLLLTTLGTNGVPGGDDDTLELFRLDDAVWPPTATWVTNRLTGANPVDVQYIRSERYALVSVKDEPGILIVNADTLAITNQASSLPAWAKPEQIAMHPMTNIAYVILGGETGAVQVVDLDTLAFSNAVEVSHTPEAGPKAGCFSPNGDQFYVSCTAISNLVAFSCTNALLPEQEAGIDLNVVSSPYGMMFLAGDRAYVASTNLNTGLSVATNYLGTPVVTGTVLTVLGGAGDMVHFTRWLPAEQSVFGFHPADVSAYGYANNGYGDAIDLGGQWARMRWLTCWGDIQTNLSLLSYNFSRIDQEIASIPTNMAIMANIAPDYDIADLGYCISSNSWVPVDVTQYLAFVRTAIERYDGDGINDMPGLTNPVRFWQVSSEPIRGPRTNFAYIQAITYKAVKEADPASTVILGAITGFPDRYMARNFKMGNSFSPVLPALRGFYVDIFDYHWYGTATNEYRLQDDADTNNPPVEVLDAIRSKLDTNGFPRGFPIWCTETSSYNGDPFDPAAVDPNAKLVFPYQTERQQAGDYFKRHIVPLSRNVGRTFVAWQIMDKYAMSGETNGYFDHTGLIYSGRNPGDLALGVRKLAYYTYKKMTDTLGNANWATLTNLHNGTGTDHLYLFRVIKEETPLHIAWWDYFDETSYVVGDQKALDLTNLTGCAVTVTAMCPAVGAGQQVRNYASAFTTIIYPITNGAATIMLGPDPVIIRNEVSVVRLISPTDGRTCQTPVNIPIEAVAYDTNGIQRVEFYEGGTKLGEDLTSPYTYLWTNVAYGNYILTAWAWDTVGNVTTSVSVNVRVHLPGLPWLQLLLGRDR